MLIDDVKSFVSQQAEVDVNSLDVSTDVVNDIDWSRVHPDEHTFFILDFCRAFDVKIVRPTFWDVWRKRKRSIFEFPSVFYRHMYSNGNDVKELTIEDMCLIAERKVWEFEH